MPETLNCYSTDSEPKFDCSVIRLDDPLLSGLNFKIGRTTNVRVKNSLKRVRCAETQLHIIDRDSLIDETLEQAEFTKDYDGLYMAMEVIFRASNQHNPSAIRSINNNKSFKQLFIWAFNKLKGFNEKELELCGLSMNFLDSLFEELSSLDFRYDENFSRQAWVKVENLFSLLSYFLDKES